MTERRASQFIEKIEPTSGQIWPKGIFDPDEQASTIAVDRALVVLKSLSDLEPSSDGGPIATSSRKHSRPVEIEQVFVVKKKKK